ncbi:tetratricopeptide repeat protein [Arthrobacter sp. ATA002]|uniref:tetratricopeptide repeat protein n=1 Tax=Arthrobacter sp. ATA002 TaxID=2991715 RepID=UPI0022A79B63|nr:tetratricopeptide repeat protein [Arthrobacter sp. ATA002]WAP51844.1 tetratricopeptide repeat protein [Arthrobacter sp. ATA002]
MSDVLDPELIVVRYTAYEQAGRHEEAVALIRGQIGHHLDDERLWFYLASGLANLGELAESEHAVREALQLVPDMLPALALLSYVLTRAKRSDESVSVALQAAAEHPQEPSAHLAVASAHFYRRSNGTDVQVALQAALNTINLSPEHEDAFALGARAADLLGRKSEAHDLLRTGLAAHPNSAVLLQAAGIVDDGERVVGDRAPLLSSALAANPFDEESAEDLRALAFTGLRRLLYLPWLQGILFGIISVLVLPNPFIAAAVALGLTAAAGGIFFLSVRRLERRLPRGYLRDEIRSSPRALKAMKWAAAAEVWVSASALWVALSGGNQLGAAALALTALPVVASQHLLGQGQYPELFAAWDKADTDARRAYWNNRVQMYLSTRRIAWAGLIPGIAGLSAAGLSESDTPAAAGAGACLAALLWLARAAYLARLQLALGADNPFVVGRVLQRPAGRESSARRRGTWEAMVYTVRIAVVPLIIFFVGAGILVANAMPD